MFDFTKKRVTKKKVTKSVGENFIDRLPNEVLQAVFHSLENLSDIAAISKVSIRWQALQAQDEELGRLFWAKKVNEIKALYPNFQDEVNNLSCKDKLFRFNKFCNNKNYLKKDKSTKTLKPYFFINKDQNDHLWYATKKGHIDVIKFLVNAGVDVNHKYNRKNRLFGTTYWNDTVLFKAAIHDHEEIVEFLLRAGADVTAVRQIFYTPVSTFGDVYGGSIGISAPAGTEEQNLFEATRNPRIRCRLLLAEAEKLLQEKKDNKRFFLYCQSACQAAPEVFNQYVEEIEENKPGYRLQYTKQQRDLLMQIAQTVYRENSNNLRPRSR